VNDPVSDNEVSAHAIGKQSFLGAQLRPGGLSLSACRFDQRLNLKDQFIFERCFIKHSTKPICRISNKFGLGQCG
jgi:hypothetical protein